MKNNRDHLYDQKTFFTNPGSFLSRTSEIDYSGDGGSTLLGSGYAVLFENSSDAAFFTDRDFIIQKTNLSATALFEEDNNGICCKFRD